MTGDNVPSHLTHAKLLKLHFHHVPMCQINFPCYFWNTQPHWKPQCGVCDALVSMKAKGITHVDVAFLGTETQLLHLFVASLIMSFLYITITHVCQCQLLKGIALQLLLKSNNEAGRLTSRSPAQNSL